MKHYTYDIKHNHGKNVTAFYLSFYEVQLDLTGISTRKGVSEPSFSPLNVCAQASLGLSLCCVLLTLNANKSAYWVQNEEH